MQPNQVPQRGVRCETKWRGLEISTMPFASILAHPGKPSLAGGKVLTRFAPIRALLASRCSKQVPRAIKRDDEELLQCQRVGFSDVACSRVRAMRWPPVALENSLQAQFITYQRRNSVQSNGAASEGMKKKSVTIEFNSWTP